MTPPANPLPLSNLAELKGLELRAAVAVEVMGWSPPLEPSILKKDLWDAVGRVVPHYESSRDTAYLVVQQMDDMGLDFLLEVRLNNDLRGNAYSASRFQFLKCDPATICRAALAVIREPQQKDKL